MSESSDQLLQSLQGEGAVLAADIIQHFGAPHEELEHLKTSAVTGMVNCLSRLRISGADRASFLHNFCTNDVKALQPGRVCEAFFVDVKARVIAHGYIAAGTEHHELWMLASDAQPIFNHLNRYIIMEDVTVELLGGFTAFFVAGPESPSAIASAVGPAKYEQNTFHESSDTSMICLTWNEMPTAFVCTTSPVAVWAAIREAGAAPTGAVLFEHHRIAEGFPVVGIDITSENMAPEADRIKQSISYTKGCYLGQEPIARLDALGHVNKKIYRCTIEVMDGSEVSETLPTITSQSEIGDHQWPALMQLKVKAVADGQEITARTPSGRIAKVTIGSEV